MEKLNLPAIIRHVASKLGKSLYSLRSIVGVPTDVYTEMALSTHFVAFKAPPPPPDI